MKIIEIVRNYLIIDNMTNEILDWFDNLVVAKQAVKERYPEDRIVRGVCYVYENGEATPWSCGKTFYDAERNLKRGVYDNWKEY